jgi:hypothetical protein
MSLHTEGLDPESPTPADQYRERDYFAVLTVNYYVRLSEWTESTTTSGYRGIVAIPERATAWEKYIAVLEHWNRVREHKSQPLIPSEHRVDFFHIELNEPQGR